MYAPNVPVLVSRSLDHLKTSNQLHRRRQLCSHSWSSQHSMEPKGSLPCPQQPTACT
jgi:hypothetical protein